MLPSPALQPAYEAVTWLYVYQDFSGSPRDQAATRVTLRLGTTSWPQHLLVDPESFEVLDSTGRSVESFLAAVQRTRVTLQDPEEARRRLQEAEIRAQRLQERPTLKLARQLLADADPVVRYLALEHLVEEQPELVAARAGELLKTSHDPTRYQVCKALQEHPDPAAASSLARLVEDPGESRNPNVVRIRAAQALGVCGGPEEVEALGPAATSGDFRNGLTRIAIEALVAIAGRHREAQQPVRDLLLDAYPEPGGEERAWLGLARTVHEALESVTGRDVPFPEPYDASRLEAARRAWVR